MRVIDKDVTAVVIESADRQIVLGHKDPDSNGPYAGFSVLPGGAIETRGSVYEAARGEVFRETGIDLDDEFRVRPVDENQQDVSEVVLTSGEIVEYRMSFFRFHATTSKLAEEVMIAPPYELEEGDELAEVKWVRIEDLGQYNHCPPSLTLFS